MNPKKQQSSRIRIVFKLSLLLTLAFLSSTAQDLNRSSKPLSPLGTKANNSTTEDKLIGKHTLSEWRHLIDSTWGEGKTTSEKLQVFDLFWNTIDQRYAAFEGIEDKWQELRNYRDTIALGVSRGRLSGILTHLVQSLHDGHVFMTENAVAFTPLQRDLPLVVPMGNELPSWTWGQSDHFGAALTPLPDSTLLVYAAVTNHPLGLVPGDIVLGYDGRLWKNLYKDLFEVQFPMSFYIVMACSEKAGTHQWLSTAGMNWHLFDTIDIVKHSTGDTVHLPTSLITGSMPGIHATEQMAIDGVPFPDISKGQRVSWGYIQGTKIGYIYILGWDENVNVYVQPIGPAFLQAVNTFMADSSSDGLIIDIRTNEGGDEVTRWTDGFRRLFNQDMTIINFLERASATDHLTMRPSVEWDKWLPFSGCDQQLYDRPIAVLSGPWSFSDGDISIHMLRQHPMTRTFGLPSPGGFGPTNFGYQVPGGGWFMGLTVSVGYTPPDTAAKLYRRSIPVDEEVWLTPDGVAKGEDDVVKRALDWITTLTYTHNVTLDRHYAQSGEDSVCITAVLANPLNHSVSVSAIITDLSGTVRDSLPLYNDGLHGDGSAGDSVWGRYITVPLDENMYDISVRTNDITKDTFRRLPDVASFTTAGPLTLDSVFVVNQREYAYCGVVPFIKNNGTTLTITNASVSLVCNDPWVTKVSPLTLALAPISASASASPSNDRFFAIDYDTSTFPGYFNVKFELGVNGYICWTDSERISVDITGISRKGHLPTVYTLNQNYPNPFNPATHLRFEIPVSGFVSLKVFDVLGREVATLVNEKKSPGAYDIEWNAGNVSSGVYFYRLSAGSFLATKKMILMR